MDSSLSKLVRGKSTFKDFSYSITCRINFNVMPHLYDKLILITLKRVFKTPQKKYNFNPSRKQYEDLAKFSTSRVWEVFHNKISPYFSSGAISSINSIVLGEVIHCNIKSTHSKQFHRAVILQLSDMYDDQHDFYISGVYKFLPAPVNFFGALQTSHNKNPGGIITMISDIKYENENKSLTNIRSYSSLVQVDEGYATRKSIESLGDKVTRNSIWEDSRCSCVDICLAIILNPHKATKVISDLEQRGVVIDLNTKEVFDLLTNPEFIKTLLASFSREELVLFLPKLINKMFFPEYFDIISAKFEHRKLCGNHVIDGTNPPSPNDDLDL